MWPLIAMAGMSMASSLMGEKSKDKESARAIKAEAEQVKANNKALIAETARAAGEIRRQQTYDTIRTAQALVYNKAQAEDLVSSTIVSNALSDKVGSSALAVRSDIRRQEATAEASIWDNNELMNENANVSMQTMLQQAKQNFGVPTTMARQDQTASIFAQGLLSVGSAYFGAKIK